MNKKDMYLLGKLTRTHGLKGDVLLKLDTDQPQDYHKIESFFVEINGLLAPFFVERQSWAKPDVKIIGLQNVTLQQAEQLIGNEVYMPLSTLKPLTGNRFYYHEVVGFVVKDAEGRNYGEIEAINDQTAQHYFVLKLQGKEVVVPIIRDWIAQVDRDEKTIHMNLPEGLLEVFTTDSKNDER